MEAGIISAARSAGLQMAAFRARQWDDPEGAVEALANFGAEIRGPLTRESAAFTAARRSVPWARWSSSKRHAHPVPPGTPAPTTSALFELTVVRENAPFKLETFLEGQHPPSDQVVVQERLGGWRCFCSGVVRWTAKLRTTNQKFRGGLAST